MCTNANWPHGHDATTEAQALAGRNRSGTRNTTGAAPYHTARDSDTTLVQAAHETAAARHIRRQQTTTFVHIPKTGGTTIEAVAEAQFGLHWGERSDYWVWDGKGPLIKGVRVALIWAAGSYLATRELYMHAAAWYDAQCTGN